MAQQSESLHRSCRHRIMSLRHHGIKLAENFPLIIRFRLANVSTDGTYVISALTLAVTKRHKCETSLEPLLPAPWRKLARLRLR